MTEITPRDEVWAQALEFVRTQDTFRAREIETDWWRRMGEVIAR
jgi:hypothetical protein